MLFFCSCNDCLLWFQFPGEITYYSIPDLSVDIMSLLLELAYTGRLTCQKSVLRLVEDAMKLLGWIKLECLEMQVTNGDVLSGRFKVFKLSLYFRSEYIF